jgi:hypothetical protein
MGNTSSFYVTHTYAFSFTASIGSSDTEGGMNLGYLGWAATMIIARFHIKVQPFLQIFSLPRFAVSLFVRNKKISSQRFL